MTARVSVTAASLQRASRIIMRQEREIMGLRVRVARLEAELRPPIANPFPLLDAAEIDKILRAPRKPGRVDPDPDAEREAAEIVVLQARRRFWR